MNRPTWKPHLRAELLPGNHVAVLSEGGYHLFRGESFAHLAKWLDGRWTTDELVERIEAEGGSPLAGRLTLSHLETVGLLCDADAAAPDWPRAELAFWHAAGFDPAAIARRLSSVTLEIRSVRGSHAAVLREALAGALVNVTDDPASGLIVVTDDYLTPELADVNCDRLRSGAPWAVVRLVGSVVWVGPVFVPGRTGCWECLAHRLHLNRQAEEVLSQRVGPVPPPAPSSILSVRLAAELVTAELLPWIANGSHEQLEGFVVTFDLKANILSRHRLTRRPLCSACGTGPPRRTRGPAARPMLYDLNPEVMAQDGRGLSADAVLERYGHHVSSITGVVQSLADVDSDGFPRASAAQSFPMSRFDLRVLRENQSGRSGGKGSTPELARAGVLCEALERYSGIWQGEEETFAETCHRLGDEAIDLATCLGFSEQQYSNRERLNAANDDPHNWVPERFDAQRVVDWTPLWSLTHERTRYLPAAFCYYGHPDIKHFYCAADSNGCAAGATPAEAIAHALLELIERDAVAIWWFNRVKRPPVDLERVDRAEVHETVRRLAGYGRTVWALDLTTDVGIPVVAAVSARTDHPAEDIIYGFAADFDEAAAATKAVSELTQSHLWVSARAADGSTRYSTDRPAVRRWLRTARRADHPYLIPDSCAQAMSPAREAANCCQNIASCVERLRALGMEVFVLDQTRAEIGLPVYRAVVPGLCHFWRRFGTPRLYEAPIRMGWLANECAEAELNNWGLIF